MQFFGSIFAIYTNLFSNFGNKIKVTEDDNTRSDTTPAR